MPGLRRRLRRPPPTNRAELMDAADQPAAVLAATERELVTINRWFGGRRLTLIGLERLLKIARLPTGSTVRVLDLGCGGTSGPAALRAELAGRGYAASVIALDRSAALAAAPSVGLPAGIWPVRGDARRLPMRDGSVDIAVCSLLLHHFEREGALHCLREMRRVARLGVVVNDLVRTWSGYVGAWLVPRLLGLSPMVRQDAVTS